MRFPHVRDMLRTLARRRGVLGGLIAVACIPRRPPFRAIGPGEPVPRPRAAVAARPRIAWGAASAESYRVTFRRSGRTLRVSPEQTLLRAGLNAGLPLAFSCQMGGCGTCKSRLVSGDVEMGRNCLSEEERAEGFCLPCVSRPLSDLELEA